MKIFNRLIAVVVENAFLITNIILHYEQMVSDLWCPYYFMTSSCNSILSSASIYWRRS